MFFRPRYVKEAQAYADAARRLLRYRIDLLEPSQIAAVDGSIANLESAARERKPDAVRACIAELENVVGKITPARQYAGWRENCEVILVAIVIAAGVRAYLLEPFKIPTGSMQPTLNGIIGVRTEAPPPNPLIRAVNFFIGGRTYFDTVAKQDDVVVDLQEKTIANYFTFTRILCEKGSYEVFAPKTTLERSFGVRPGRVYSAGQPIVRGYIDNGDFLLVNKMTYNFVKPARGDVFVFKTTGIDLIERTLDPQFGSQHYIKRLAGLPGDNLRIDPPNLYVNGRLAPEKVFQRVMAAQDGYGGYTNGGGVMNHLIAPDDAFTVPPHCYFALGDNSANSSDSRYWGIVPRRNVTGKGFVVFWPFSKRWGFIN